ANIEIRKAVGARNFFLFGLNAVEVAERKASGYNPREIYEADAELKQAIDMIASGFFSPDNTSLFQPLVESLINEDRYMTLADYAAYVKCQGSVSDTYQDPEAWSRMSVLNVARMGWFSSDRAIEEYCRDIWRIKPVHVTF
ncbi:MAG: glycogen/starch/alpha-glucan phosphorylase, partial [Lentisphaerae bacterium]|nr:glycogen/starch/alpha-glucan phosphorylase [Lentisphaerota bacterium]